jgi:hypothetical protein
LTTVCWTGHSFYDTFARIRWPEGDEPQWDEDASDKKYQEYDHVANTKQTRKRTAQRGDRVGLLLDLDKGTLAVYKNDHRLGVVSSELAGGAYCWAATLFAAGSAVRIEKKPVPESDENTYVTQRRRRVKRQVGQRIEDCRAVKPKTAADHQHTFDYARIALDTAVYATPAAPVMVAQATVPTVCVEEMTGLHVQGPPEPIDDPTDENAVGMPAQSPDDDDDQVTSMPVAVGSDIYPIDPGADDNRLD